MELSFDEKILVALYRVAVENGEPGGYRISQFMPEGSNQYDARLAAERLISEGYITMPQKMCASPIVYITEKGFERAQELMMLLQV